MSKTFLPYDPDQQLLLPAALQEWLPADHLAYFISDVVDQLDLSEITVRYREQRGGPPYHPRMMVKVLLYGYCTGVSSVLPENRQPPPQGHRLPGAGRQQHAGFPHRLRLSQGPSGGTGESVRAGAGPVPASRAGEAGPCGVGRDQGQGQRLQAQGHELSADEREESAVGIGGDGVAAAGRRGG